VAISFQPFRTLPFVSSIGPLPGYGAKGDCAYLTES